MFKKYIFILLTLIVTASSCVSIKTPKDRTIVKLDQLSKLDGVYSNFSAYGSDSSELWTLLATNFNRKKPSTFNFPSGHFVQLTANGERRILIQLYKDSVLQWNRVVKGKVKGDRFVMPRKVKWIGLPLVFLWYSDYRLQLTKAEDGSLYVDGTNTRATWVLLFTGGTTDYIHSKFSSH